MIKVTEGDCKRIHQIFRDNHNKSESLDVVDMVDLGNLINTHDVLVAKPLCESVIYWQFLHACLINIETGHWRTMPRMWVEVLCISRESKLSPFQIEAEYINYLNARKAMCDRLELPSATHKDKEVTLYWFRQPHGEDYILGVAHALLRAFLYFTQTDLKGIHNNAAYLDESFDAANQSIWPVEGDTKFEIMSKNFKEPWKRHDKMI